MPKQQPIAGRKFGKLTAICTVGEGRNNWRCICDCGNEVVKCIARLYDESYTKKCCDQCAQRKCTVCGTMFIPLQKNQTICRSNIDCKKVYHELALEKSRQKKKEAPFHTTPKYWQSKFVTKMNELWLTPELVSEATGVSLGVVKRMMNGDKIVMESFLILLNFFGYQITEKDEKETNGRTTTE